MTLVAFIALMIALAALWIGSMAADNSTPPPRPQNTPRQNAAGCWLNIGLALCGLALLVALYFVVG